MKQKRIRKNSVAFGNLIQDICLAGLNCSPLSEINHILLAIWKCLIIFRRRDDKLCFRHTVTPTINFLWSISSMFRTEYLPPSEFRTWLHRAILLPISVSVYFSVSQRELIRGRYKKKLGPGVTCTPGCLARGAWGRFGICPQPFGRY